MIMKRTQEGSNKFLFKFHVLFLLLLAYLQEAAGGDWNGKIVIGGISLGTTRHRESTSQDEHRHQAGPRFWSTMRHRCTSLANAPSRLIQNARLQQQQREQREHLCAISSSSSSSSVEKPSITLLSNRRRRTGLKEIHSVESLSYNQRPEKINQHGDRNQQRHGQRSSVKSASNKDDHHNSCNDDDDDDDYYYQDEDEDDYTAVRTATVTSVQEKRALQVATDAFLRPKGEYHINEPPVDYCSSKKQTTQKTAIESSPSTTSSTTTNQFPPRGGATQSSTNTHHFPHRPLVFWENMICGAVSRSIAQTVMHPANTMKTILQSTRGPDRPSLISLAMPSNFRRLTRGAGANFVLSLPHGAINFAVLEFVRAKLAQIVAGQQQQDEGPTRKSILGPGLDFLSSTLSTICCSVISTPQMMITDNIMCGNYPNLPQAVRGLAQTRGLVGFYAGWWPGLVGKIPSYALTWTFFQELKHAQRRLFHRPATDAENTIMGCLASATAVCIMIPMDTIKTRLVTQAAKSSVAAGAAVPYKGIVDCAIRVFTEEGIGTFYRGLPPRLLSVVPMMGIQFGVYEFMKKVMLNRRSPLQAFMKNNDNDSSLKIMMNRDMTSWRKDKTTTTNLYSNHLLALESSTNAREEEEMKMAVATTALHTIPGQHFDSFERRRNSPWGTLSFARI